MFFILSAGLVILCSVLALAIFRPLGRTASLLGVYLLCYANIVLVGEVTNSLHQLNNRWLWLALEAGLVVLAWYIWRGAGSPSLLAGFRGVGLFGEIRRWPELWLLSAGVTLGFLFNGLLIWLVPPNNNDSLATHMARVGFWLQRGSFFPWPTDRIWQVTYPINMQLQIFWNVLFLGSDRIVEAVQWLGAIVAVIAIYGLAQLLGAARPQALFAGLIWATFPEIILESTTTQNDLVAGTLFAVTLYFLFLGMTKKNTPILVLSALALALALGTKQTVFFLLPGMALSIALFLIYQGKAALRGIIVWGGAVVLSFALVGAYVFIVNQINFGYPMGPETAVTGQTVEMTAGSIRDHLVFNTARLAYQAIDPTGLPDPLTGYGFKMKALVAGKLASWLRFPIESPTAVADRYVFVLRERYVLQEDAAWYGPLFSFLVLPAVVYQGWVGIKRREPLRVSILLLGVTFWVFDAVFRPGWDPFQGRYFIPVVIPATACAAFVFQLSRKYAFARWGIVILALVILYTTINGNVAKPVSGSETVWKMTRLEMITRQSFYMRNAIEMVEKKVPADATLGLFTQNAGPEYPFFRPDFSRRLMHIYPAERLQDAAWLTGQGIEYVLVAGSLPSGIHLAPGLTPIANSGVWTLFTWKPIGN